MVGSNHISQMNQTLGVKRAQMNMADISNINISAPVDDLLGHKLVPNKKGEDLVS